MKQIKKYLYTLVILIVIATIPIGYALYLQYNNNFHVVIPSLIYRSNYPTKDALQKITDKYHISSILNVSGTQENYEYHFAKQHSIDISYIPLSAHGTASKQQILQLINVISNSPKPLLIHCIQGADRTGLAAAIAIITNQSNYKKLTWSTQMSFRYGVISPNSIGYHVLYPYYNYVKDKHIIDNKQNFINWLNNNYHSTTKPYGWFWLI
jgi:hypothetical protein